MTPSEDVISEMDTWICIKQYIVGVGTPAEIVRKEIVEHLGRPMIKTGVTEYGYTLSSMKQPKTGAGLREFVSNGNLYVTTFPKLVP